MKTQDAAYLFHQGTYNQSYEFFGSHLEDNGDVVFRLWAPKAQKVAVVGDFNGWNPDTDPMERLDDLGGIWELRIPNLKQGDLYKYAITQENGNLAFKADPYAFYSELRPATASVIWDLNGYKWSDDSWFKKQRKAAAAHEPYPMNIYEMHLGSWRTHKGEDGEMPYTYDELAEVLPAYLADMGYTHVEIMPVMEHPFDGSWGYQLTGFFSATSRYGTPQGLMHLIDALHEAGIHVILDWVPGHFCKDAHGLYMLDGTYQYEAAEHPQWGTMEFDYGKPEVVTFLVSNAYFWFDMFHADGLRIDGVASMLYLNYGYDDEWRKNEFGGNDDLKAVAFLRKLNTVIFEYFPYAVMAAEESTAYPMVSWPVDAGGLGFNYKWDMGWMHDTLSYMMTDPYVRSQFQNKLTFSMSYAFSENYILPLSHDEVVHGKKTLVDKMFGEYDAKFDQYRLLLTYMMAHPGKKLTFMGSEFAPFTEWRYYEQLEWFMAEEYENHKETRVFVNALNHLYKKEKAFWQIDDSWDGFKWIDPDNASQSIVSFRRIGSKEGDELICLMNFVPIGHEEFRIGVPEDRTYRLVFNTDAEEYGGKGTAVKKTAKAQKIPFNGLDYSIVISVPPMSGLIYKAGRLNTPKKAASKTAAKGTKAAASSKTAKAAAGTKTAAKTTRKAVKSTSAKKAGTSSKTGKAASPKTADKAAAKEAATSRIPATSKITDAPDSVKSDSKPAVSASDTKE
ncbi:MAG: 1,4-alpha-glucan branching protein GlgB [Eubacteriaceae bacterium]|jgi:1,4-alpha-glucan branching enzyme